MWPLAISDNAHQPMVQLGMLVWIPCRDRLNVVSCRFNWLMLLVNDEWWMIYSFLNKYSLNISSIFPQYFLNHYFINIKFSPIFEEMCSNPITHCFDIDGAQQPSQPLFRDYGGAATPSTIVSILRGTSNPIAHRATWFPMQTAMLRLRACKRNCPREKSIDFCWRKDRKRASDWTLMEGQRSKSTVVSVLYNARRPSEKWREDAKNLEGKVRQDITTRIFRCPIGEQITDDSVFHQNCCNSARPRR